VNKENWTEQPWQWDASTTQLAPRIDGFGGNPIFSNMAASANKPSPPCAINQEEPCSVNFVAKKSDLTNHGKKRIKRSGGTDSDLTDHDAEKIVQEIADSKSQASKQSRAANYQQMNRLIDPSRTDLPAGSGQLKSHANRRLRGGGDGREWVAAVAEELG